MHFQLYPQPLLLLEHREKERNIINPLTSNSYGCTCFLISYRENLGGLYLYHQLPGYIYIYMVPYMQTEPVMDWTYVKHSCIGTEQERLSPCVVRSGDEQCGSFNTACPRRSGCCLECWAGSYPTVRGTQWKRPRLIGDGYQGMGRKFRWLASHGLGPTYLA